MLVAVDPGVHACGVAVFLRGGQLERAAYVTCAGGGPVAVAGEVRDWFGSLVADRIVIERPQVYIPRLMKGDPNDLINLAMVVGALLATLHGPGETVLPASWKGQVPKDIMVNRIKKRLAPEELARAMLPKTKDLQHNVFDAIGIGLWAVGRL